MFQEYEKGPDVPRGLPIIPEAYTPKLKRVNRKPITATDTDLDENNRAQCKITCCRNFKIRSN